MHPSFSRWPRAAPRLIGLNLTKSKKSSRGIMIVPNTFKYVINDDILRVTFILKDH